MLIKKQYMVATMLSFNRLTANDYADGSEAATSPLVEDLRKRIKCVEDPQYTIDYHEPTKRTIPNALTVTLNDGTVLDEVAVEAPLGHRLRREEAKPEILDKYKRHLQAHFDQGRIAERGTHEELLAQDGLYRQIYESQFAPAE